MRFAHSLICAVGMLPALSVAESGPDLRHSDFALTATAQDFPQYFPTYLANGFLSVQSSLRGTDATPSQIMGLMDYTPGDVSRPAAVPSWAEIDYFDGTSWLNADSVTTATFKDYRQTLNLHDGTLTTQYVWTAGGRSTRIEVTTLVSEHDTHLGMTSIRLTPDFSGPIQLRLTLHPWPAFAHRLALADLDLSQTKQALADAYHTPPPPEKALLSQVLKPMTPTSANRAPIWYPGEVVIRSSGASVAQRTLWMEGQAINGGNMAEAAAIDLPSGLAGASVNAETSPAMAVLQVQGSVQKGRSYRFTKYVTLSALDWGGSVEDDLRLAQQARGAGFKQALKRHQDAWHTLWQSDIRVAGNPELQRAIHADLFYLLENSSVGTSWPFAACGFTPNYFGHVFWDNDSWDFPVLLLLHPERAQSQIRFRYKTLVAAEERARSAGYQGAMYPWESDPALGTDQTPHFAHENAQQEIHVNGDVAIAQWQFYLATSDNDWLRSEGYPVIRATADFWVSRVVHNASADRYEILDVTSPDEAYTHVNNDSFTNAVAQRNLLIAVAAAKILGDPPSSAWQEIADKLYVPFSEAEQRHLDFDPSMSHDKQTWMGSSVSFLAYPPLDLEMTPSVRTADFEFAVHSIHALTPDANAMVLSMMSLEALELGRADTALEWLMRQQGDFLKGPFLVRSETARNNTISILATSAGFLQNFLYGFSGLRVTDQGLIPRFAAVLPSTWKALTLKNITFRGMRFDYVVSRDTSGNVQALQLNPRRVHPAGTRAQAK